jgi:hypothetical protein
MLANPTARTPHAAKASASASMMARGVLAVGLASMKTLLSRR